MRVENKSQLISRLSATEQGLLAENKGRFLLALHGWEISDSRANYKWDTAIRNPITGEMAVVQIKKRNKKDSYKTYSDGAGHRKGGRRHQTSYADEHVDYYMIVDIDTDEYFFYPHEYYKNYSSISTKNHPGIAIPLIEETPEAIRNKRLKNPIATLDLLGND